MLIINLQDNEMNDRKLSMIENALLLSLQGGHAPSEILECHQEMLKKKKIVIRNYCYFMKEIELESQFLKIQEHATLFFIWEDHVAKSTNAA